MVDMIDLKKFGHLPIFYRRNFGHNDMESEHDEYVLRDKETTNYVAVCIADEDKEEAEKNAKSIFKRAAERLKETNAKSHG